jgi:acid phosphatase
LPVSLYDFERTGDPVSSFTNEIANLTHSIATHPSEPNYCAVAGGDNFGMDNDDFHIIPSNISNVADMLEYGGISWAEYQQSIPYPGFAGFNFSNQQTFANMYVRKHNPLILYENIMSNSTRNRRIKDFPQLDDDIANKTLPQWGKLSL